MHLDRNLVVIDVETSGTDTDAASIIQLGAVKLLKRDTWKKPFFLNMLSLTHPCGMRLPIKYTRYQRTSWKRPGFPLKWH